MTESPKFPRHDPSDTEGGAEKPLATSRWQDDEKVQKALSYDEHDPEAADTVYLSKVEVNGKPQLLGFKDPKNSHIITFAATGAGKTSTMLIPALLTYTGGAIVLDPKGELASTTAKYRSEALGQKVVVIDPFRRSSVSQKYHGAFNPLADMSIGQREVLERIGALADSMVIKSDPKSLHFDEAARSFIKAVMLYILTVAKDDQELKSMALLREFVTVGIDGSLDTLLDAMMSAGGPYGSAIAAGAAIIRRAGENERGGMLSTVSRSTEFLDSLDILSALDHSTIDLTQIKEHPTTIYLVLPEEFLDEYNRYLRLMLTTLLNAIKQTPPALHPETGRPRPPMLFILEELASLGYMPQIERAAGLLRSFGARLWFIFQDINQAKANYPKSFDSLIGNAGILTAFGNSDQTTLEYLSKRLGQCEVSRTVTQHSSQSGDSQSFGGLDSVWKDNAPGMGGGIGAKSTGKSHSHSVNHSQQLHTVPLMQPDEIARFFSAHNENMLVSIAGALPIRLKRIKAYKDAFFKKRLKPNPQYRSDE